MIKKYISVLEILPEIIQYLSQKGNTLYIARPSGAHNQPLFLIDASVSDAQTQQITLCDSIMGIDTGRIFELPYILELEYLRNSHFELTTEELNLINQMLILQLFTYCRTNGEFHIDRFQKFIYTEDLDKNPERVEEIIKNAYEGFVPFQKVSHAFATKHSNCWLAAPVSSYSAYQIIHTVYTDEYINSRNMKHSHTLLFMPLIMVFSLLELETDELKRYTYCDYKNYISQIFGDQLGSGDSTIIVTPVFSYGRLIDSYIARNSVNNDQDFICKINNKILKKMQEVIGTDNTIVVSIQNLEGFRSDNWTGSIGMLLNYKQLSWEKDGGNQSA